MLLGSGEKERFRNIMRKVAVSVGSEVSMSVTVKDIARMAGTSVTNTSLVLSGKWEKKVRKDIAAHIRKIADKHNYACNPVARALVQGRKHRISLCVDGLLVDHPLIGAFSFHEILAVVTAELHRTPYGMDIDQVNTFSKEDSASLKSFLVAGYDGVMFLGWQPLKIKKFLKSSNLSLPYIVVDADLKDKRLNYAYTDMDESAGRVVEHFIQNGHRRIGFVRSEIDQSRFKSKLRGYKKALDKHGIVFNPAYVTEKMHDNLVEQGYESARLLFSLAKKSRPSALFCSDNLAACGVLAFLRDQRIAVPGDVAVIGFGDRAFADMAIPHLSFMERPMAAQGEACVKMLLEQIDGNDAFEPRQLKFREELIIQQTSA